MFPFVSFLVFVVGSLPTSIDAALLRAGARSYLESASHLESADCRAIFDQIRDDRPPVYVSRIQKGLPRETGLRSKDVFEKDPFRADGAFVRMNPFWGHLSRLSIILSLVQDGLSAHAKQWACNNRQCHSPRADCEYVSFAAEAQVIKRVLETAAPSNSRKPDGGWTTAKQVDPTTPGCTLEVSLADVSGWIQPQPAFFLDVSNHVREQNVCGEFCELSADVFQMRISGAEEERRRGEEEKVWRRREEAEAERKALEERAKALLSNEVQQELAVLGASIQEQLEWHKPILMEKAQELMDALAPKGSPAAKELLEKKKCGGGKNLCLGQILSVLRQKRAENLWSYDAQIDRIQRYLALPGTQILKEVEKDPRKKLSPNGTLQKAYFSLRQKIADKLAIDVRSLNSLTTFSEFCEGLNLVQHLAMHFWIKKETPDQRTVYALLFGEWKNAGEDIGASQDPSAEARDLFCEARQIKWPLLDLGC